MGVRWRRVLRRRTPARPTAGPLTAMLCALGAAAGCRDAPAPFDAVDRGPAVTGTARLTFSAGDEHAPVWSADGSRIVYSGPGFAPFPETEGLLLSIPAGGGSAEPLLPSVQIGTVNPGVLAAPVLTRDGRRAAFLQVLRLLASTACAPDSPVSCDGEFAALAPMLRQARLRVRDVDSAADPATDAALELQPEGVETGTPPGSNAEVRVLRDYPFQRSVRVDGIYEVGPSWDPSGARLVFSDGRRLLLWTPGDEAVPIPGTEDGLSPAWSPEGEWIAFVREAALDSTVIACQQSGAFGVFCRLTEVLYETAGPTVELVRPDGSDSRMLVTGRDPAWSPDGARVYYAAADGIRSVGVDGGSESLLVATAGGREPAVSPDGTRLAFTRRSAGGGFDLWVTPIP